MAMIKCKMCGGDLNLLEGQSVVQCEYCGSFQTVPVADDERKLTLFARANLLRHGCEFDKAAGIYETIAADFPEEAESYWGLVLCKYGIEYVDDPGTGKKIPTCHRSSFDSILEDRDFALAMEHADGVARRVYREEAEQLEQIRQGILAISSREEPFDIFICYKETDENGDRTLDSVLAQDLYDALTDKGYRVFFSRITLEDKLGREYEPYIFAALHSAKVMLAVGTSAEHYNSVWVRNEWSRFLRLMARDKEKYLIPCYRNLCHLPREFLPLQGQDMGKIGAMQDLLRGIEKLCGKTAPEPENREPSPVRPEAGKNRVSSLLNLGELSLEDREWKKALGYFEEAIRNDGRNPRAWIGKLLAREECSTLAAFVRKRAEYRSTIHSVSCSLKADKDHIDKVLSGFVPDGYVDLALVRRLYAYDLTYMTALPCRKQQLLEEREYWKTHPELSKAEQYADGDLARQLAEEKERLFAILNRRIAQAEETQERDKTQLQAAYAAHLAAADSKTETLRTMWKERREKDYQSWVSIAQTNQTLDKMWQAQLFFESQGTYRDSPAMVEQCKKRISELQIQDMLRQKAEKEARQHRSNLQYVQERKHQTRFHILFWLLFALGVVAVDVALSEHNPEELMIGLIAGTMIQGVFLGPGYVLAILADKLEDTRPALCRSLAGFARTGSGILAGLFLFVGVVGFLSLPRDFLIFVYVFLLGAGYAYLFAHLRKYK